MFATVIVGYTIIFPLGFTQWQETESISTQTDQIASETESNYEDAQSQTGDPYEVDDYVVESLRQSLIKETTLAFMRLHSSLVALRKQLPRAVSETS